MQATPDAVPQARPSPPLQQKANKLPEYAYQIAILVVVVLLLWSAV